MTRLRMALTSAYWAFVSELTQRKVHVCPICEKKFLGQDCGDPALLSDEHVCRKCRHIAGFINSIELNIPELRHDH